MLYHETLEEIEKAKIIRLCKVKMGGNWFAQGSRVNDGIIHPLYPHDCKLQEVILIHTAHISVKIDVKKSDYYLSCNVATSKHVACMCPEYSCSNLQRDAIWSLFDIDYRCTPIHFCSTNRQFYISKRCRKYRALQFLVVQPPSGFCCCCKLDFWSFGRWNVDCMFFPRSLCNVRYTSFALLSLLEYIVNFLAMMIY